MIPLLSRIVYDGPKNAVLQVSGFLVKDIVAAEPILLLKDLHPWPKALRLDSIVFAVQEKMGCVLWWKAKDELELILPVESRGKLDFEGMQGLHSPNEGTEGIYMSTFKCTDKAGYYFLLFLDLMKQ